MTVRLPWATGALWPNRSRGVHWSRSSDPRSSQRRDAAILFRAAGLRALDPQTNVTLTLTFCAPPRTSRYDLDNALASQKGAIDGLADVLGVDDSRFSYVLRRAPRAPGTAGGVLVDVSIGGDWQHVGDVAATIQKEVARQRANAPGPNPTERKMG